ncbi:MAG TPA: serine/threonine-protein kinase [Polyangiaceae bacterium]|nr:serine/threonine-protein kinase [Polyangiaceae bacterium]
MAASAPLPERLGAYRLRFRLPSRDGTDEYAAVEEGPLGFRREVLLKLAPSGGGPTQAARDLAREAAAVSSLNHPGLVRMYEFFEYEGRLVLVLERGEGTNLGRLLARCRRQRRPLEDEAIFHVAHRIAAALAHAHGREAGGEPAPVVHRALGPAAVLLGWDASVRLSGFGFAKILRAAAETTQLGITRGVPGYLAPEQLRGEPVTERADVYQLGLLVWEMLANRAPGLLPWASGPNGTEVGARPEPVGALRPTVPPEIVAALEAALEPDPERRTLRAADLERWLARTVDVEAGRDVLCRRLAALRGSRLRPDVEAPRPRPRRRSRRGARRWEQDASPSVLASVEALARSPLAPPPEPGRQPPGALVAVPPPPAFDVGSTLPLAAPPAAARPAPPNLPPPGAQAFGVAPGPPSAPAPGARQGEAFAPGPGGAFAPGPGAFAGGAFAPGPGGAFAPAAPAGPGASAGGAKAGLLGLARRPGALGWAAVTGVVVGLVVAVLLLRRERGAKADGERAASADSADSAPGSSAAPAAAPPEPAEEAPLPLPRGYGSLAVRAPIAGYVYINGAPYGPSERPVLSPCGRRYVRVGAPPEPRKRTVWRSAGVWTTVPCGESTELTLPGARP